VHLQTHAAEDENGWRRVFYPMKLGKSYGMAAAVLLAAAAVAWAQAPEIPKHGRAVVLFDGKDLDQFDTFLPSTGLNSDPKQVFTVENATLHIHGREFGYIVTKQEFKNYYLRAEFKWGEGPLPPRTGHARDSGILYNMQGPNRIWPRSIEFQIREGCTGDFLIIRGASLTGIDGVRRTGPDGPAAMIDHFNKGVSKDVVGYRDPGNELEKPHGKWNVVELVNRDGHLWQYVNGKLANEGTDASPSSGKILFQCEGAEVFFRNIKLYPLK
jgi:hypothetical protein